MVLECVPSDLARTITEELEIPTIGIGAGSETSGQVLVFHDLLGLQADFKPKFLKRYCSGFGVLRGALKDYDDEVKAGVYPCEEEHSY